ncbi:MAG: CCA tRNA nucleotidyltransferase [Alphaproteobacteria bacterium]|nr:CCA tRNA nucleotidyltransferase [Alphaproteobacteria bacterium]
MKPAQTIEQQDWMSTQEVRAVMDALGGAAQARFVGGCVRNALLDEEVGDIDIATTWTPEEVTQKLEAAGIKVVPTGIDHGTVTAVTNAKAFEITTLRKDVQTDGRRAVVAYTDDWAEDAQRRDFTMNTLLADMDGNIYDPTGKGLADLQARKIIFVGEPAQRIAEDYLRILRFFRFHAFYGQGEMDKAALKACTAGADKIETLSKERITQEFLKILSADQPQSVLDIMFENGILSALHFEDYSSDFLRDVCTFQNRYGLGFVASRLFALAGLSLENIKATAKFLLFPKVFVKDIEAIDQVLKLPNLSEEHAVKVAVYKYGRVPTAQALMIELANDRVMNNDAPAALEIIQKWDIPNFPVSGDDLIKEGFERGPALGEELTRREEDWIAAGFKAT